MISGVGNPGGVGIRGCWCCGVEHSVVGVNATFSFSSRNISEYQSAVYPVTDQNLGDVLCIFAYQQSSDLQSLHPSYVKVVRDVPRRHELLMPGGYGKRSCRLP